MLHRKQPTRAEVVSIADQVTITTDLLAWAKPITMEFLLAKNLEIDRIKNDLEEALRIFPISDLDSLHGTEGFRRLWYERSGRRAYADVPLLSGNRPGVTMRIKSSIAKADKQIISLHRQLLDKLYKMDEKEGRRPVSVRMDRIFRNYDARVKEMLRELHSEFSESLRGDDLLESLERADALLSHGVKEVIRFLEVAVGMETTKQLEHWSDLNRTRELLREMS